MLLFICMLILFSVLALVITFILSTLVSLNMKYENGHWLFEIFHLLAGFFVAMFFSGFTESELLIVLATMGVGIFWETLEILIHVFPKLRTMLFKIKFKQGPITLADTILDLILDFSGALLFVLLF